MPPTPHCFLHSSQSLVSSTEALPVLIFPLSRRDYSGVLASRAFRRKVVCHGDCGCVDVAAILVKYVVYISIWIVPLWKDKTKRKLTTHGVSRATIKSLF